MVIDEKTKIRLIIKTYLKLKGKATAAELSQFINKNYRFAGKVTPSRIAGVCRQRYCPTSVLYGLKEREIRIKDKRLLEYYY